MIGNLHQEVILMGTWKQWFFQGWLNIHISLGAFKIIRSARPSDLISQGRGRVRIVRDTALSCLFTSFDSRVPEGFSWLYDHVLLVPLLDPCTTSLLLVLQNLGAIQVRLSWSKWKPSLLQVISLFMWIWHKVWHLLESTTDWVVQKGSLPWLKWNRTGESWLMRSGTLEWTKWLDHPSFSLDCSKVWFLLKHLENSC